MQMILSSYIIYMCGCHGDKLPLSGVLYPVYQICQAYSECLFCHCLPMLSNRLKKELFLMDLHVTPFEIIYNFSDPNEALSYWIDLFLHVLNKHMPLKRKRVKHQTPTWLNTDVKQAMLLKDKLTNQKKFVECKQQRNRVNYLVREAKKKYFQDLAGNKADTSSVYSDQHTQ